MDPFERLDLGLVEFYVRQVPVVGRHPRSSGA